MADTTPKQPRPLEITAGAEPIKLGSMLLTVVEPHPGHEVAYNRWYERDHFYAGCMVGPYNFAGRRYVATADLKALRDPDPSEITGAPARGSYVAVYWVLDGYHDIWNRWAVRQVRALHAAGRMFEERDHVHTLLYRFAWEYRQDPEGVPVELALDHPYEGFVPVWVDRAEDVTNEQLWEWLRTEHLPALLPGTDADLVAAFTPLPLLIDAPGDVPRQEAGDRRTLLLWFLHAHPATAWEPVIAEHRRRLDASGLGTVVAALPFVPTIPGTDTYTGQLWD
jgi:hypothetical protein